MEHIKTFESYNGASDLIIVDVQKSFKKFFTEIYLNNLKNYCKEFTSVYQIWDNHINGKKVSDNYLFNNNHKSVKNKDLYTFPNQKGLIEKRYNYGVNSDFYKKDLSKDTYLKIKKLEKTKKLKKGNLFSTKKGTVIVYVGNNHKWFHVPKKLYKLLKSKKGKLVYIVGGSDLECLEDLFIAAESIGVIIKRNWKYIYSSSHCPY